MNALRRHYDGPDEAKESALEAKQRLATCFYKHEYSFSFEKFITVLQGIYKTLERYDKPMYESQKLDSLLDRCQNNRPEFKQEVVICRIKEETLIGAIVYLKTVVARLFPESGKRGGTRRQVSAYGAANTINGVDISNVTRWFDANKIQKIKSTAEGKPWQQVMQDPQRKKANAERLLRKRKKRNDKRKL